MKTLEVTDEQYAFIQHLREEISESVVGKYGFVRERDAVQYLIDNLDGEIEFDAAEFDSSATDDVAASVGAAIDGDDDPHELEEVSYIEGETETAAVDDHPDDLESDETEPEPDDDESAGDDPESSDEDDESDAESGTSDDTESDTDGDADSGSDDDSSSEGGSADDDDMLDEMMSLLETHDDKWQESSSADYRYAVDLPDGSTEQVQTKDDVRALLFKNYR
ncbi:hypothetical protein E2L06_05220 [Haloterrigena sp. H1]|uniref:hypothetical protein n=1 Tax=Haloterrigena sp. H1 TaxID=2552943 RepID=UPI00110E68FB|nr:hypothetical protein [Haloterrigena sp. H1]TMT86024.1 hypothetical protein E2L06_05220 [Haloterrigena sp. H1]